METWGKNVTSRSVEFKNAFQKLYMSHKLYFKHVSAYTVLFRSDLQQVALCGVRGEPDLDTGSVDVLGQPAEPVAVALPLQHAAHEHLHRPKVQLF